MRRALSFAGAALLLAGCGGPSGSGDRTVIRYLLGPDIGGAHRENIARFERLNPDIEVELVEGPSSTDERERMYAASFAGEESAYDLVYADVIWVPRFAAEGWLRPLDPWFTAKERKRFLPGDMAGSCYKGKIYRVPVQTGAGMLYYRKDLLRKHGIEPPRTWAELAAAAKRIQRPPELWGFVWQGKGYEGLVCDYLELLWGNGGRVLDVRGGVRVDEPPAVEALSWLVDAVHAHRISPPEVLGFEEEDARRVFQEGGAVFMRNWPYVWNLMNEEGSPVRDKVGIVPMVSGGRGRKGAAVLGGWGFGISSFSENPEAAWRFAQFMAAPESQKVGYLRAGIIPSRKLLYRDPDVIAKSPHYKMLYEVVSAARPRPVHPSYSRMSGILQTHLSAALSKKETPERALKAAADEIRSLGGG